jgi:hypothetical protein
VKRLAGAIAVGLLATLFAGCATAPVADRPAEIAYVVLGANGQAVARVVTRGACPRLRVDGEAIATLVRAEPATVEPRAAVGPAAQPARFAVRVCEAVLRAGAREARWGERRLPLPAARVERIVVLGDTGCRLATFAVQDCADAAGWPFQAIARAAAAEQPDLVIHVGDYHYREAPCAANAGCAGAPWGYGWDAWSADFFEPAAPLLAAAPWVVVRGNHEECARAGQGWFRFLDPGPWTPQRSCDRPEQDDVADFSEPYAVPLGANARLVVFDSSRAGNAPLDVQHPKDARTFNTYVRQLRAVDALAAQPGETLFVSHHPPLAFAPGGANGWLGGNPALVSALRALHADAYWSAGVSATLHGHVHLFEALSFATPQPPAIVAGTGGDLLDDAFPEPFPADASPAPNVRVAAFAWAQRFGYLVMERTAGGWNLVVKRADGTIASRCALLARTLSCR